MCVYCVQQVVTSSQKRSICWHCPTKRTLNALSTELTGLGIDAGSETVDWQDARLPLCCITAPESMISAYFRATAESDVKTLLSMSQGLVHAGLLTSNCVFAFAQTAVRIDRLVNVLVLRVRGDQRQS